MVSSTEFKYKKIQGPTKSELECDARIDHDVSLATVARFLERDVPEDARQRKGDVAAHVPARAEAVLEERGLIVAKELLVVLQPNHFECGELRNSERSLPLVRHAGKQHERPG